MEEFYQGIVSAVAILGGLCTFIYWVFNLMEKRLDIKIDSLANDVRRIADELKEDRLRSQEEFREERRSKDYLYQFVINNVKIQNPKQQE